MSNSRMSDDLQHQAATLAFALLRFAAGAAHLRESRSAPGSPRLGTDFYVFSPSPRHILIGDVPSFLSTLPSPALLVSSTARGSATLILVDELAGERRQSAERGLANQQTAFESLSAQLGLGVHARILLQFDDEEFWLPIAALRRCCSQFAVDVGWTLCEYQDDVRAHARLVLIRSDGHRSWAAQRFLP